ncbi:MAG: hypothetical protein JWP96_1703 [Polaromonas sp.]|nr:hypothetical protein [Polaromonas sp.]
MNLPNIPPLSAALLCCLLSAAQAAEPQAAAPAAVAQHPLTASWSWVLPGKQCTESLQYRANGGSTSSSGEETTHSRYQVSPLPSLQGFYRIAQTVIESNGKPDCAGDVHAVTGEPVVRFIQFSPKQDRLIVCKAESLKECFGPLRRIAP